MRKGLVVVVAAVFMCAAAGGAFAQNKWYASYAPGIEGSKFLINGGIGFGLLPYKMSRPPISASVEYAALAKIPLSIGAYFGISGYDEEPIPSSAYKGTLAGIGARASWHFGLVRNLDTYISLNLGYLLYTQEVKTTAYGYTETREYDFSTFYYGFNLGLRYFFIKKLGVYLELGYSAISIVSAGLSVKF